MTPGQLLRHDLHPAPDTWSALASALDGLGPHQSVILRHAGGGLGVVEQTPEELSRQQRCLAALRSPALLSVLTLGHDADESVVVLAHACTLRIAGPDLVVRTPSLHAQRLPVVASDVPLDSSQRAGLVRLWLGDTLTAADALNHGLVDVIADAAAVDAAATRWARAAEVADRSLLSETLNLLRCSPSQRLSSERDALHRLRDASGESEP